MHFNKTKGFIRYLLVYLIFVLPFKIYKLKKSGEPLWLLRKNFVIRMKNRNYFLVNCYSRDDYFELLRYFGATKSPWRTKRNLYRKLKGWRYFSRTSTRSGATMQTTRKYQKTTGSARWVGFLVGVGGGKYFAVLGVKLAQARRLRVGNRRGGIKSTEQYLRLFKFSAKFTLRSLSVNIYKPLL